MDHAIYTAMSGASQTLNRQAVTASNMANASTPGFRAQLNAMRAVPVQGASFPTRTLVAATTPGADMSPGSMEYTGRPLDVAVQQNGWLTVQTTDGSEAYTHNGNMQISPSGQLTIEGNVVMGEGGPIAVPQNMHLSVAEDGTISGINPGDSSKQSVQPGKLKLVNAESREMVRGDDGMFRLTEVAQQQRGAVPQADATLKVMPGVLEGSNVKPVGIMVDMVSIARSFELQMKVISSLDENEQRANQILNISA